MGLAVVLQAWDLLLVRVRELLYNTGTGLLDFALALAVVLVGSLIGLLVGRLVALILRVVRFNHAVRTVLGGLTPTLHEPSTIVGWGVQGLIVVMAVMLAFDILGFALTASVTDRMREVLPRVASATIVLAVGVAIAILVGGIARRVFKGIGMKGTRVRGQIVTIVLTGFTVLLALEQLGLAAQFIIALGLTAVASVGLAIGLAFGLGCKDLARDVVVEYLKSLDEERPRRT